MKKLRPAVLTLMLLTFVLSCQIRAQGASFEKNPNGTAWGITVPFSPDSRARDYPFELYRGSSAADVLPQNLLDKKEAVTASPVFLQVSGFDPSQPGATLWLRVTANVRPLRQGLDSPGVREQKITLSGGCGCSGLSSYEQPFYYGNPLSGEHPAAAAASGSRKPPAEGTIFYADLRHRSRGLRQ